MTSAAWLRLRRRPPTWCLTALVVALILAHGVRTIRARDRDYRRFSGIEAGEPFE